MSFGGEQTWILFSFPELADHVVGHCSYKPQRRKVGRELETRGVVGEGCLRPLGLQRRMAMVLSSHINDRYTREVNQ